jgi:hypothetical protein
VSMEPIENCPLCLRPMALLNGFWRCGRCRIIAPTEASPLYAETRGDAAVPGGRVLALSERLVWIRLPDGRQSTWVRRDAIASIRWAGADALSADTVESSGA